MQVGLGSVGRCFAAASILAQSRPFLGPKALWHRQSAAITLLPALKCLKIGGLRAAFLLNTP